MWRHNSNKIKIKKEYCEGRIRKSEGKKKKERDLRDGFAMSVVKKSGRISLIAVKLVSALGSLEMHLEASGL